MKKNISIQLKAALLLVVFALNTVVGFACAIGIDMNFNTSHHENEETAITVHVHADGKKHHHEEAEHNQSANDKKDDCCNNKVVKLLQTDKAIPQSAKLISSVFSTALVPVYYSVNISCPSQVPTSKMYFVRGHHPPIPDIRIAIQSFQI